MPKPIFSRDDYFQMLDKMLAPEPETGGPAFVLERLRENIRKRKEFGIELPKLNGSLFGGS